MVTEKNSDVQHDFFKDPLRLQLAGDWLKVHVLVSHACHQLPPGSPVECVCVSTTVRAACHSLAARGMEADTLPPATRQAHG